MKTTIVLAVLFMLLTPIATMAAESSAKSVAVAENGATATAISGAEAYGYNSVAKADAGAYANGPGATAYSQAFAKDIRYYCKYPYNDEYAYMTVCYTPIARIEN